MVGRGGKGIEKTLNTKKERRWKKKKLDGGGGFVGGKRGGGGRQNPSKLPTGFEWVGEDR